MPSPSTVVADRRIDNRHGTPSAVLVVATEDAVQTAYEAEPTVFDEKRGGLGLALPIARRVIEAHGGRLWAPAPPAQPPQSDARGAAIITIPLETDR
jgi:nitrogen fixation/metabolism regulation signal transduction histidine kinase